MELRHLEYFVAVAEERNYTRAAARLHIVQSAVSAAIKSLERDLGAPLLDRNSKRVLLTDAGAALLPRAIDALDAVRAAQDSVNEVRGGMRGNLRIGVTSARAIDCPALLGEYHRRYPGVQLYSSAAPSGSQGLIKELGEHRLDLAFASLPGPRPPGIRAIELTRSVLDLVVPTDHPLAERSTVAIEELAAQDFIDSPIGFGNRTVTDLAFAQASIKRHVTIEITDIALGADYVRHGLGLALLPGFAIGDLNGVCKIPVTGADLTWPVSLASASDRVPSAAARALIDLVRETISHEESESASLERRSAARCR
jgi:DNA-binding transcriptional LysR family regulator